MRVALDTNVFVSGLLARGTCRRIFPFLLSGKFTLVISKSLIEELAYVIARPKFRVLLNAEEKNEIFSFIGSKAIVVTPKIPVTLCRDMKDNMILETALEAKADIITTGDKDLLILETFRKIPIMTPRNFLKKLMGLD